MIRRYGFAAALLAVASAWEQRLQNLGFEIVASPLDVFAVYIRTEIGKRAKVVKASGAKAH